MCHGSSYVTHDSFICVFVRESSAWCVRKGESSPHYYVWERAVRECLLPWNLCVMAPMSDGLHMCHGSFVLWDSWEPLCTRLHRNLYVKERHTGTYVSWLLCVMGFLGTYVSCRDTQAPTCHGETHRKLRVMAPMCRGLHRNLCVVERHTGTCVS